MRPFLPIVALSLTLASCSNRQSDDTSHIISSHSSLTSVIAVSSTQEAILKNNVYIWGSDFSHKSPSALESLLIRRRDKEIEFPLSLFNDLTDVREIQIKEYGNNVFWVVFRGGDASTSYSATLKFVDDRPYERIVRSGEFPQDFYQVTHWHYNNLDN